MMADDKQKEIDEARKASDADTKAYYERVNGSQPTPTQQENDRAKLGFDSLKELDNKEDGGAPSEADARVAAAKADLARANAGKSDLDRVTVKK
jgi:hypothetical protein